MNHKWNDRLFKNFNSNYLTSNKKKDSYFEENLQEKKKIILHIEFSQRKNNTNPRREYRRQLS